MAIRFYERHGWTEDKIRSLISTSIVNPPLQHKDAAEPFWSYWVPEVGTVIDIKKLMKIVTKVDRTFNDHPHQTDEQFLQNYNW
jgi:hypothetical protein